MGEVTEKVYCCDRGDNGNALAAAYLMFLALFRNGGFGFGGGGAGTATQGIETQAQLNAIRTQLLHCLRSLILCIRKSKKQSSVLARLRSPSVAWKNS